MSVFNGLKAWATVVGSALLAAQIVHATPIVVRVSGTFNDELEQNTTGLPYPFPTMFGGSFSGRFSYDSNAAPTCASSTTEEFDFDSVSVDIFDNT